MALSDSMFLFELLLKDFKTYKDCNDFYLIGHFENILRFKINTPKEEIAKGGKKLKGKQKSKVRTTSIPKKSPAKIKMHTGQSIIIINTVSTLMSKMLAYPLELFLCNRVEPYSRVASTIIPWSNVFLNYLSKLIKKPDLAPPIVDDSYDMYDEETSKRIATINFNIKLTYLSDKITSRFLSLSEDKQSTFLYTQINSKPVSILSNVRNRANYNSSKDNVIKRTTSLEKNYHNELTNERITNILGIDELRAISGKYCCSIKCSKSEPLICNKVVLPQKSKSFSSIYCEKNQNVFQYIFADPKYVRDRKFYYVGYFTVEKDDPDSSRITSEGSPQSPQSGTIEKKFKFKKCDSDCLNKTDTGGCSQSLCSTDLPEAVGELVTVTKCQAIDCDHKEYRELPPSPDERILLDLNTYKSPCCGNIETKSKIEEVLGGVTAKIKVGEDPCFCTCECTFGFTKKTTYCNVCGGYEIVGEDLSRKIGQEMPIPCPIFHKLIDKNKLKTYSTSGSESKKRGDDQRSLKAGSSQRATSDRRQTGIDKKDVESEKDSRKGKKKKKDDRFKFHYGYKGIPPQIGHSKCALPCTGTLANVPKKMGWLWTAEDIPGMKFRPMWKPGATNKHVVRLLKIARNPGEVISKKKRKDTGKKKRPLKRPLLVVHKKDGEYTVTMETMKSYNKPRALNQHPYEDKPVVTYTIGRTEEENRERLKKKERAQRRLERAQRHFIQSAFRDMCHEICLKTYQQALGILPDAEDPPCTCYPALPTTKTTNMDVSCSCSEESASIGSDTDSDEWIIEFTPPNAAFDPTYKGKKVFKVDNGTQYTYLDYRVKLLDHYGNPVPRFFKGPDGKQQCSDLGGFWSPDHKWLEINIDGYVAPDGKWAPNIFIGPNGEQVDGETGKFQAMNGKWLVVGVDGYVDSQGKWRSYTNTNIVSNVKKRRKPVALKNEKPGEDKQENDGYKSENSWSCFGAVSPRQLSKLGIVGHGGDRKLLLNTLQNMLAKGEDVKIPQPSSVYHIPNAKKSKKTRRSRLDMIRGYGDEIKCHHPSPSDKGIIAVDAFGNKTYFRLTERKNKRPKDRLAALANQGISLSSFHVPCFHSFINAEVMKQQQRERLLALASKNIATQVS
ncbi:uncharacterized protein LOC116767699 isoform X1 [Danaus plexippus]|uniref:uncharacterized protein LOC116767699 isoform X1 n=1 Tax=Danaus plexippus TaxID=13037 RepID=UPI002AAF3F11|nr:uncharacterized protein LOC116767699 isoform X1 [Danaus plexippus]